jgi:hypothetical protein
MNDRFWVRSDLSAFGHLQSVLNVNARVADRAVDLGMAEKDLNGAEVASRFVGDGCVRAPKRVRPVILSGKADAGYLIVHEADRKMHLKGRLAPNPRWTAEGAIRRAAASFHFRSKTG